MLLGGDFINGSKLICPECASEGLMRVAAYISSDGRISFSKGIKHFHAPAGVNNCNVSSSKYNSIRNKHLLHPELY